MCDNQKRLAASYQRHHTLWQVVNTAKGHRRRAGNDAYMRASRELDWKFFAHSVRRLPAGCRSIYAERQIPIAVCFGFPSGIAKIERPENTSVPFREKINKKTYEARLGSK